MNDRMQKLIDSARSKTKGLEKVLDEIDDLYRLEGPAEFRKRGKYGENVEIVRRVLMWFSEGRLTTTGIAHEAVTLGFYNAYSRSWAAIVANTVKRLYEIETPWIKRQVVKGKRYYSYNEAGDKPL